MSAHILRVVCDCGYPITPDAMKPLTIAGCTYCGSVFRVEISRLSSPPDRTSAGRHAVATVVAVAAEDERSARSTNHSTKQREVSRT